MINQKVEAMPEWKQWLIERQSEVAVTVEMEDLNMVPSEPPPKQNGSAKPLPSRFDWGLQIASDTGKLVYGRIGESFFRIIYVHVKIKKGNREVGEWWQPLLQEMPHGGYVVLAMDQKRERFLLTARIEPGNTGEARMKLGAPVQMSIGNAKQAHGGTKPPRYEWQENAIMFPQPQDGGRYYEKTNQIGYVIVDFDSDDFKIGESERLFSAAEFREAKETGECNPHLAEAYSFIFDV